MNEKNTAEKILKEMIEDFSIDSFVDFFREKNRSFIPSREKLTEDLDNFDAGEKLGEISFDSGDKLVVCSFKVKKELSERSGKKAQYQTGRKILKESNLDAGIFIFYDEQDSFRFSLIHPIYSGKRREWSNFKRFTYLVSCNITNRTFLQRIGDGDFSSLENIKDAFSVEKVTKEFFDAFKYALKEIVIKNLKEKIEVPFEKKYSFALQLLSRILFIYFVQKKGWLKWVDYISPESYMKKLWMKYKSLKGARDTFYSVWLSNLFFSAFNGRTDYLNASLPDEVKESFGQMPFLNGGLFHRSELDEIGFEVSDKVFEWLFEPEITGNDNKKGFLEIYNFTIDESSPYDAEVAVDPEMIGKVYESLISQEEQSDAGIFYTPRTEIDFMCHLSLVEYLVSEIKISKMEIIPLIFEPERINKFSARKILREIKSSLEKLKIVDPACGSASFLVGMMNVLVELHTALTKKLEGKEENLFALKEKIILENLYGVDVKDWAVMVGELRLWLSLIIETNEKYMDIHTKPLLPNLSFKIRQGDSLVEEIAGINISLRNDIPKTNKKIIELVDRKKSYFSGGRSADLKEKAEIEKLEQEVFKQICEEKLREGKAELEKKSDDLMILNNGRLPSWPVYNVQYELYTSQEELETVAIRKYKIQVSEEIEELKNILEKYNGLLKTVEKKKIKDYFLWEIDFAEVFSQKDGFDIVLGNPPFVRQERIAYPLDKEENFKSEEWKKRKSEYKNKLAETVKLQRGDYRQIGKRNDLYVYFYYRGLSLLRRGGIFCFINSNSWLDVGYGAELQEFLLKRMHPLYIVDNTAKRSFARADINTVIVLIKRPKDNDEICEDDILKFIAFKKPFEEVLKPEILEEIENTNEFKITENYRVFPKARDKLLREGVEMPEEGELDFDEVSHLPYIGNKWGGKYLRAPDIYFKILEKGKDKLVRLGDIAEVRRGFTTGANEFFYLDEARIKEWKIEKEFLKAVIKSPRECKSILINPKDLKYKVFMCHKSKFELKGTNALKYIEWGREKGYHKNPTCKNRKEWWQLNQPEISDYLWMMTYRERFFVLLNGKIFADARFYDIYAEANNKRAVGLLLNSTLTLFNIELMSRTYGGGGGPVDVKVYEVTNLMIIKPDLFSETSNLAQFLNRKISTIFEEYGINSQQPIREQEPKPLPDRKELDDIIFDILGLTKEERKEVYWSVCELVKNRLEKAKNV